MRSGIDFQNILHRGYESAARLGRDDPVLAAVRLEGVFLSVRWIVESLAASTMPSSATLLSRRPRLQRAWPSGGCEQASTISRASAAPSKILAKQIRQLRVAVLIDEPRNRVAPAPVSRASADDSGLFCGSLPTRCTDGPKSADSLRPAVGAMKI